MRTPRLYLRILFSFLGILAVTELLILVLFVGGAGRIFKQTMWRHVRAEAMLAQEYLATQLVGRDPGAISQNKNIRNIFERLAGFYDGEVWLTQGGADGPVVAATFSGPPPEQAPGPGREILASAPELTAYRVDGRHRALILVPIDAAGTAYTLHLTVAPNFNHESDGAFVLGLLVIGLFVALLVLPVVRRIQRPLKELAASAMRLAEGELDHRAQARAKDEIGDLARTFNHMADRLQAMVAGGRELTANLSHELRSPLARLRVGIELARQKADVNDTAGLERHLGAAETQIDRMDRLIGRMLELSKADMAAAQPAPEPVDLADLADRIMADLTPLAEAKNLQVDLDLNPAPTTGDKQWLLSALENVLDNAVNHTPQNGRIHVATTTDGKTAALTATNTAATLTGKELEAIFTPFARAPRTQSPGTGLGLSIAQKIVTNHQGQIQAKSHDNTFQLTIALPRR